MRGFGSRRRSRTGIPFASLRSERAIVQVDVSRLESRPYRFVMAGGGTGGHIFPALAVAKILRSHGHEVLFVGTREGLESRLVPEAGYRMEYLKAGGLNRVGLKRQLQTALQLPASSGIATGILTSWRPDAVFSTGGYVAGPVVIAAMLRRLPLVVMEPNAMPGFTNRKVAPFVTRALVGFEETRRWFPPGRTEVTGLPIRAEFFQITRKRDGVFTLLITGGSRGARSLNRAARESWPLFRASRTPIRILHQTGINEYETLRKEFGSSGVEGEVVPFLGDMAAAFASADLVLARSGAGSVGEIAAAGMPSILVPLPFAADDHQRKNAEALVQASAAKMVLDRELDGKRLFDEVEALRSHPEQLAEMSDRVRDLAHRGAAERAASVLEEAAARKKIRAE
jgi:UDP-N-acetylglucosamine--N-acetylmuramyl-(pentapeptide) pyrophosphoryl-undecaprenol N-acetylglucosamine transferase